MTTPKRMRWHISLIAIWALALVAIFSLPWDLPGITGFAILFFPLGGFALLIVFTIAVFRGKEKRSAAIAILLVILIGVAYRTGGVLFGARLHLLVNRSRYEATIAELSAVDSLKEREAICGDGCMILSNEPLRVSFHFCHAFLYWPDIVNDPTGAVCDKDISRLHQLNTYLFSAERLSDNWYLANFGD